MKIFNCENLELEQINEIKKESNVYYSKKFNCFLITDNIFEYIDNKYQLMNGETDKYICTNNMVNWVEMSFDGEEVDFFRKTYQLSDFAETAIEALKFEMDEQGDLFTTEDWGVYIEEQLKVAVMVYIGSELEDEINELQLNNYDINILKMSFKK